MGGQPIYDSDRADVLPLDRVVEELFAAHLHELNVALENLNNAKANFAGLLELIGDGEWGPSIMPERLKPHCIKIAQMFKENK